MSVAPASAAASFVESHAADAPAALIARVLGVLGTLDAAAPSSAAETLLEAAEALLGAVLAPAEAGREMALDLLAADACVTWALEAAADQPQELSDRAERMMARIAEVAP